MRKNTKRFLAALTLMLLLPALAFAAEFAVVRGGRLNLRQYADASSSSLGKYSTGSWVRLDSLSGSWWYVRTMDGKRGYMNASYLDTGASQNQGTVNYANGGYVTLRVGPGLGYDVVMRVTSGSTVYIQNNSNEWNYVYAYVNGTPVYGYMHESFISGGTTRSTVTTRNGGRVNLRSGPDSSYSSVTTLSSGTVVTVLLKGNGWYKVSANGYVGYMSTEYLSEGGAYTGGNTGSTTSSTVAYVNNPKATQVLNLRESPSQSARSIGQYRNGTKVKVVSRGATWCEVYVGTRHGYMMTRYLSFNGQYLPPAYVQPTQPPVYHRPWATPTPKIEYWPRITPTPTPLVQYITPKPEYDGPQAPQSGDYVRLAISAGSSSDKIKVYHDASMTALKATYSPGKQVMMLKYGTNSCMIYVDGGVAYVSTWNINY
ncbi:MAG: SH3 domain-containing protein [Clostridia bacterium]|nr:SH3 domain-containing protein [Clostridia bacterium]